MASNLAVENRLVFFIDLEVIDSMRYGDGS